MPQLGARGREAAHRRGGELGERRLALGEAVVEQYQLGGWEIRVILRAFLDVFPDATLHLAERNEAILLGRTPGVRTDRSRRMSDRVRADLARIGMDDEDPLAQTLVAGPSSLRRLAAGAPALRFAWPAPELAPLAGPRRPEPLDRWIESLARGSTARGTFASILLPAVAPFVRIQAGRARADDRSRVARALVALLRRDPDDPYVRYMLGCAPRRARFVKSSHGKNDGHWGKSSRTLLVVIGIAACSGERPAPSHPHPAAFEIRAPMFSPDGRTIARSSNRHGAREGDTNVFVAQWVD